MLLCWGWLICSRQFNSLRPSDAYMPSVHWVTIGSDDGLSEPMPEYSWWRHRMETFFALLAICARNSPVAGEFPAQRPVTRSFDVFFDLRLNSWLSKQWWGWWFETQSRPLWRQCNVLIGTLGTNISESFSEIHTFSFKKMHLKMSVCEMAATSSRPQCVKSCSVTLPRTNWLQAISNHTNLNVITVSVSNYTPWISSHNN